MMRSLLCLGLFFAALLAAMPQPARAAYPCPGGPGPGEVQVGVSGGSHGIAAVPVCERTGGGGDGGGGGGGGGAYYVYGSVAWHPDADDVWMAGKRFSSGFAEHLALEACNRAMGGGCTSIGEWYNSSMTIIRDNQGTLYRGWNGEGGAERKRVLAECSLAQQLPCEVLHSFDAGKSGHTPNLATARKRYASAAWAADQKDYARAFIASGYPQLTAANDAALAACGRATGQTCVLATWVANGLIQSYRTDKNWGLVVERNPKRATRIATAACKSDDGKCVLQRAYDSRTPGEFVHDFRAAATK